MGSFPNIGAFAAQAKKKLGAGAGPAPKPQFGGAPPPPPDGEPEVADPIQAASQAARMVAAGNIDPQIDKLMKSYDPEQQVPAWAIDEDLWQQAEAAVQPNGKGSSLHSPWLNVALTYKLLKGRVQPMGAQPDADVQPMGATDDAAGMHPDDNDAETQTAGNLE